MALSVFLNRKLIWLINFSTALHMINLNQMAALESEHVNKVKMCPQNLTEWQKASRRLNCSDDAQNPINMYHCLPVHDLSTLLEFCYTDTRPRVVKGLCMTYVQEKKAMKEYNCTTFDEGCPNEYYFTNEAFKFPNCMKINVIKQCFVAETSCGTSASTNVKDITSPRAIGTTLSGSGVSRQQMDKRVLLFTSTAAVVLLVLVVVAVLFVCRKRNVKRPSSIKYINEEESNNLLINDIKEEESNNLLINDIKEEESNNLLINDINEEESNNLLINVESEVEKSGIKYLLQNIPKDKKEEVAKLLQIPKEIMFWSKENRALFVEGINHGKISVYNGRVMVIGCAEAGKTTLVKKLKGEKHLGPQFTIGIEIHPHEFKLDEEEHTIIACNEQEKIKGCLCITLTTLNPPKNIKTKTTESKQIVHDEEKSTYKQSKRKEIAEAIQSEKTFDSEKEKGNFQNPIEIQTISRSGHFVSIPADVHSDEGFSSSQVEIDFSACEASVNDGNLKMLSILDFAGQSAYYACHHIFFSSRAFYILVVDISKDLEDLAKHACEKPGLIYSDWTYADYIRYWFGSIHTYGSKSAPVILVASHSEEISVQIKEDFFFKICRILPKSVHNHIEKTRVFFVEKDSDINMKELKMSIAEISKSQDEWGTSVPIAWARLESVLRKSRESCKILRFAKLFENIRKEDAIHINSKEEFLTAINFFHETGVILFRKDIIILDVQWFVGAFKCIIMDERHVSSKNKSNYHHFDYLNDYGLLKKTLLDDLWENEDFLKYKTILVDHMKHLDMLAELDGDAWYVPCMNKQKYTPEILQNCNVSSTVCFLFEFLPFVIFHRLVVACINKSKMTLWKKEGKYCIYHTVAILQYGKSNHRVLIGIRDIKEKGISEHYPYSIEIQASTTNSRQLNKSICAEIKECICDILADITSTFHSCENHYQVGYRCIIKRYRDQSEGNIVLEGEMNTDLDCNNCAHVHTVDVKSICEFWESKHKGKEKLTNGQEIADDKTEQDLVPSMQECEDISISNVDKVVHISQVTPEVIWFNNSKKVMKIDHSGHILTQFETVHFWGSGTHNVDVNGNALFIKNHKIMRKKSNGEDETLFTPECTPLCIYVSQINEDILISVSYSIENEYWTKITRYDKNGKLLPEFEYDKIHCKHHISPLYLCENINTDICISDNSACLVKVFDKQGTHRFSYNGRPLHADFSPTGICNDYVGHILVCNQHKSNPSVHLLDKDGKFLSLILHDRDDIKDPWGLCVSDKGKLYLGQNNCSVIKVFRFLEKD